MRVLFRRLVPGIGDAIMMEPVLREAAGRGWDVSLQSPYSDLFLGQYTSFDGEEFEGVVVDLGEPCPCARHESKGSAVDKGRVQIFLEAAGFEYHGQVPRLMLSEEDRRAVENMRDGTLRIGVSTVSGTYGNRLDGWRDYPYGEALAKKLAHFGEVHWLHTSPPKSVKIHWERAGFVDLKRLVASMDMVVAIDNGIAHLAGALSVPLFGMFGPTSPWLRIKGYPKAHWIPKYEKCGRAYCWYHPCRGRFCLTTLKPQEVVKWVQKLLK